MTDKECTLPCNFEDCDGCAWRMTDAEAVDILEKWNKCQHIDTVCTVDCGECEYNTTAEQVGAALARAVEKLKSNGWISVKDRLPVWSGLYLTCNMRSNYVPKVTVYRKSAQWFDEGNPTHWMPLPELPSVRK